MKYSSEAWLFFGVLYFMFTIISISFLPLWGWFIVYIVCFLVWNLVPRVLGKREKNENR